MVSLLKGTGEAVRFVSGSSVVCSSVRLSRLVSLVVRKMIVMMTAQSGQPIYSRTLGRFHSSPPTQAASDRGQDGGELRCTE